MKNFWQMFYLLRCALALVFFMSLYQLSEAQIVNIETKRIQSDTTGWLGSLGTGFLLQRNATKVISINANGHVEYKSKKSLYLFLVSYNLLEGDGKTLNNNLFYHLRYNYKVNSWLRWEAFSQVQNNNVTGIKFRFLAGTGPRFKILSNEKISLYAATSVMYEHENEKGIPPIFHRDLRSNNYVSFSYRPVANAEIVGTAFYQPLFKTISDYRLLNELSLKFQLIKNLSFSVNWFYLYDSEPAGATPNLNYSISNGIEYKL